MEIRAELTNHRGCSLQGGSTESSRKDIQMVFAAASKCRITGLWAGKKCELCLKNSAWLLCVEWRARGAEGRHPVRRLSTMVQARQEGGSNSADGRGGGSPLTSLLHSSPALSPAPWHRFNHIYSFALLKGRFEKTGRLKKVFKIKNNKNYFLSALC